MRKINIFDTTLRDGEQAPDYKMCKMDKIIIAKKLDEMGIDVIEAGFASSNDKDNDATCEIAKVVKNARVVSLTICRKKDIDIAYEAVKNAKYPGIHIFIATSDIHIKDKLKSTREKVLEDVSKYVSYAKSKCDYIEFSLEDATRTDKDYACKVIDAAIDAGATVINIPDTVGFITPEEFAEFLMYIKNNSRICEVQMSVHCHNDLGLATSNTLTAIQCGANQVECTVNGIGERAGNTALEQVVAVLKTRKNLFDAYTNVDTTKIKDISNTVVKATGNFVQKNYPVVGFNAFRHEAGIHQDGVIKNPETYEIMNPKDYGVNVCGIVLGIHSGKSAVIKKMIDLGYNPDFYDVIGITNDLKNYFEDNDFITNEIFISIVSINRKKEYCKVLNCGY